MGNVPPRRVVSAPTTIKVNPANTGDVWTTVMGRAVQGTSGWSIDAGLPTARGFKWFECDETNRGTGRHLSDWEYHPVASGAPDPVTGEPVYGKCDYTTDGYRTAGGSENFHTAVNWAGKGVYDPVRKRVQYMTKGTGSEHGQWVYNLLAIYRLGQEETEGWKSIRGWRATTPPDRNDENGLPLTHFFYNNCIDVIGRRHYKKQFQTTYSSDLSSRGPSGPFHVFNLDTEQFEASILAPSWDPLNQGMGPCEFIPTRGSRGKLWYCNGGQLRVAEYDVATGTGQRSDWVDVPGLTGADDPFPKINHNFNMNVNMGIMCGNPRAFGGLGAVLVCGGGEINLTGGVRGISYIVTTPPTGAPTIYEIPSTNLPSTMSFGGGNNDSEGHICPHPTGSGWLMFGAKQGNGSNYVWSLEDSPRATWQNTGHLVPNLANPMGPVTTIEELGIVWMIGQRPSTAVATTPRAWIYKP